MACLSVDAMVTQGVFALNLPLSSPYLFFTLPYIDQRRACSILKDVVAVTEMLVRPTCETMRGVSQRAKLCEMGRSQG